MTGLSACDSGVELMFLSSVVFYICLHKKSFHVRKNISCAKQDFTNVPSPCFFPSSQWPKEYFSWMKYREAQGWFQGLNWSCFKKTTIKRMVLKNKYKFLKDYIADLIQTIESFKNWRLNYRTNDKRHTHIWGAFLFPEKPQIS